MGSVESFNMGLFEVSVNEILSNIGWIIVVLGSSWPWIVDNLLSHEPGTI